MATEAVLQSGCTFQNQFPHSFASKCRPRTFELSVYQISPAAARKIQNHRIRKWGSCSDTTWNEMSKSRSAECLKSNSCSSLEVEGGEESAHLSQASLLEEHMQGGTGSPAISQEETTAHHDCEPVTVRQGSPFSESSPPPTEAAQDCLVAERSKSKPPSGDVKSSVSSLGGEWDPSSEVDSVLLSIQSSIEQVEEGVLTMDDFFFTVKHLIEDYMYVDCGELSPHYEEVPEKRQFSSSHIYIDLTSHQFVPPQSQHGQLRQELMKRNTRSLPRAVTVCSVVPSAKRAPPVQQSMTHPVCSTLTRSQSDPSLFTGDVKLNCKKQLKRSLSSQISLDQDGYSLVRNPHSQWPRGGPSSTLPITTTPPALPPRPNKFLTANSGRPLPSPPVSPREVSKVTTTLPPHIPRRPPHTMRNRQCPPAQSFFAHSSSLKCDTLTKTSASLPVKSFSTDRQLPRSAATSSLLNSFPLTCKDDYSEFRQQPLYEVSTEYEASLRSATDSSCNEIFPFSPPVSSYGINRQYTSDHVAKEDNHSSRFESVGSDDDSDIMVNVTDVVARYRNSFTPKDLELPGLVRSASLDDIDTPSSIHDMPDSWLSTTMLSSARSTDELSTQHQERHPRLHTQYQVRHSRLCSTSLDNLVDVVPLQTDEENTYSIPPDAVVGYVEPLFLQPMQSYFRFLQIANVNHNAKTIHMKGTLTVRSRRGTMRERYFILHRLELQMHTLRGETRKASKSLLKTYHLDQWCQMRVGNAHNGFVLETDEEELELIAGSGLEHYHWVENISQALKSTQKPIAQHQQCRNTFQGPVYAVINGLTFKCSGAISDRHLKLYSSPEDDEPFYTLPLQGASMSKENEMTLPGCQMLYPKPVCDISSTVPPIHLHGNGFSLHLLFQDEQEYNTWHYYLCLDSDMECPRCRPLEEAILKLRSDADGGESSSCDECKGIPLTTLPSLEWEEAAVEMYKHIKVFMSTSLTSAVKSQPWQKGELSYFATFIQNVVDKCLKTRQLRNEFYCQIISLINKHSFENSMEALQGWLLLAITIPFFLPLKPRFLWYLEQHINKHLYSSFSQVVAFAVCCRARLARAVQNKERMCRPAFCELLHQLSQFPEPPNDPIVHDVLLSTGSKMSISFDSSSTVQEVVSQINQELGLPSSHETGFSLACDWPGLEDAHVSLHPLEKMLDVVSAWNCNLASTCGLSCSSRCIQFVYCSRVYFRVRAGHENSKEALLLVHQVNQEIVNSRFEVDLETAKELSAIMLQVEQGNMSQYQSPLAVVKEALWKVFPMKETRRILDLDRRQHVDAIFSLWKQLQNTSKEECIRLYLQRACRIPTFGYRHFQVQCLFPSGPTRTTIAVGEDGIQITNGPSSQQPVREIPYHMVESFGSSGTGFMLYVNSRAVGVREKMTFGMPQVLVQELTLLIASYMEVFLKGIYGRTSSSPSTM